MNLIGFRWQNLRSKDNVDLFDPTDLTEQTFGKVVEHEVRNANGTLYEKQTGGAYLMPVIFLLYFLAWAFLSLKAYSRIYRAGELVKYQEIRPELPTTISFRKATRKRP